MIISDRPRSHRVLFLRAIAAATLCVICPLAGGAAATPFLTPREALATFQVEPGLRIELVAAEPLVVDPVAFAFDGQRRLYVVEDRGYPDPPQGQPITHQGRVAMLEDTNGDGRYDRRTEFATGLSYPNGITVWRGGVFVTCAPDIFYLKDTDNDGVADERRVVLTGFDTTRTGQIRVSSPTLGLDGKIYVACGLNGGTITSPEHPDRPAVVFKGVDGRFDPETLVYEAVGGRGQFGLTFDAFGRRFVSSNRHPVLHTVLSLDDLRRNPYLPFSATDQEVSKAMAEAKVFPISRANVTADFMPALMGQPHSGTFTSACGVLIYDGAGLSPEHAGNAFVCEPAQNLVQRQVLRPEGASFRSTPPHEGKEFLASTDTWFRPVFLGNGPDGALYVADMHRREIDHPEYVPKDVRATLDFESGKASGRIYRIVRNDPAATPAAIPATTTAALERELESANAWSRELAQRRLVELGDLTAVPLLEKAAVSAALAASRVRALWTLHGLKHLSTTTIQAALHDADAGVREQGVMFTGERLASAPDLLPELLAMANDPDPRVRFQCALALGSVDDARAVPALAAIAVRDGQDRWARAAVISGIATRLPEFFAAVSHSPNPEPRAYASVMEDLGRVFGAGASLEACRTFLTQMLTGNGDLTWRLPSVLGLGEGLRGRPDLKTKDEPNPFVALLGHDVSPAASSALKEFFQLAATLVASDQAATQQKVRAVTLLGYTDFDRAGAALGSLLDSRYPPELQLQAVSALEHFGDPRAGELLIQPKNWAHYTPQMRAAVISALISKPQMIAVLFAAIERRLINPAEIAPMQRNRLLKHNDPTIRKGAETAFHELQGGDRMKVYEQYRDILKLPADPARGTPVFARACSACHTFSGVGGHVGPDLTGIRNQPADALLLHIIVPNYEVYPGYQAVSVTTGDGRTITGRIATETESSLTLNTAYGTEETVLRNNISSLAASSLSLMPDGMEQTMTKNELADLLAYLKSTPAGQ